MLNITEYIWVYRFVSYLFTFYYYAIFAYILMSWVPQIRNTFIGEFLTAICEPFLKLFRKIIPPVGMLDISPIAAVFALGLIQRLVFKVLFG